MAGGTRSTTKVEEHMGRLGPTGSGAKVQRREQGAGLAAPRADEGLQQKSSKLPKKIGGKPNGSDFSSARGSEERTPAVTTASGRGGQRRARDFDIEQVSELLCKFYSVVTGVSRTSPRQIVSPPYLMPSVGSLPNCPPPAASIAPKSPPSQCCLAVPVPPLLYRGRAGCQTRTKSSRHCCASSQSASS